MDYESAELKYNILKIGKKRYRKAIIPPPTGARSFNSRRDEYTGEDHNYAIQEDGDDFLIRVNINKAVHGVIVRHLKAVQAETGARIILPHKNNKSAMVEFRGPTIQAVVDARQSIDFTLANLTGQYTHFISLPLNTDHMQGVFQRFRSHVLSTYGDGHGDDQSTDIDASLFMKPARLHITCCMLALYTQEALSNATQVLKDISPKVNELLLNYFPLEHNHGVHSVHLNIGGVGIMQTNPKKTNVLFAKIADDPGLAKLREILMLMINAFIKAGVLSHEEVAKQKLIKQGSAHARADTKDSQNEQGRETANSNVNSNSNGSSNSSSNSHGNGNGNGNGSHHNDRKTEVESEQDVNVKFHLTLMNTKYRKERKDTGSSNSASQDIRARAKSPHKKSHSKWKKRIPFDASGLLNDKETTDIDFGRNSVGCLQLSALSHDAVTDTDYYHCVHELMMNP